MQGFCSNCCNFRWFTPSSGIMMIGHQISVQWVTLLDDFCCRCDNNCLLPPPSLLSPHNWYADSRAQPQQPQAAANNHQPLTFRCRAHCPGQLQNQLTFMTKKQKKGTNNLWCSKMFDQKQVFCRLFNFSSFVTRELNFSEFWFFHVTSSGCRAAEAGGPG